MKLFAHNQRAYEAAVAMLAETGKAAVIHPAGTGKSFIGFKLCAANPDKRILWISDSEYIFRTKLEKWVSAGGETLGNIVYQTCTKLLELTDAGMAGLKPDYIVLDEFHRGNADIWSAVLNKLLPVYMNTPILGLSSTDIRYPDNQRDMADELFRNSIASEMTIGEAIARGALNPPKFGDAYDAVFERNYHSAVDYFRKHGNLDCKADYVDSDGVRLGAWLNHLRTQYKKRGRFILSDEQFRMLDAIGMRWDSKFDRQWDSFFNCLTSYIARTSNADVPATWKEGKISLGAWLRRQKEQFTKGDLRPDRAEKLTSLGVELTIEDPWEAKFRLAKAYSDAHGGSLAIPHDLKVNGVRLSKWLNDQRLMGDGKRKKSLTNEQRAKLESIGMVFGQTGGEQPWERHYQAVKSCIESSGSTDIPKGLKDTDGVDLRHWLQIQIGYARKGKLPAEKAQKLKAIGVQFEQDDPFEIGYVHAKAYFEKHGSLTGVRKHDTCDDGFRLSTWIHNLRSRKKNGRLTDDQVKRLEAIGMVWNVLDAVWEEMFEAAKQFAVSGKPLTIPVHYCTESGRNLYDWYSRQRRVYAAGKLPEKKYRRLLSIGAVLKQMHRKKSSDTADSPKKIRKAVNS